MSTERILILDDEPDVAKTWVRILQSAGYACVATTDAEEALGLLESERPDLLLTDLRMAGLDGMEMLKRARQIDPRMPVVILTGYASVDSAVAAVKAGAFDYLSKSFSSKDQLIVCVERALTKRRLELEVHNLRDQLCGTFGFENIVGRSPTLQLTLELVRKVARSDANILILGESGTGKELVARAIHANSNRASEPFVPVDCAAMPETLLESELFGYEKGAFTGAVTAKQGLMEAAHRGTLFLDELGELPLSVQAKLLRALQEREIRRLGGTRQISIDVRIVSATNRDLREQVSAAKFREDLYYRVNVIDMVLPPLRERSGDVELLARYFLGKYAKGAVKGFAPECVMALESYSWPGNVRELQNVIERACALTDGEMITLAELPAHLRMPAPIRNGSSAVDTGARLTLKEARERWIGDLEAAYVANVLKQAGGNVSEAARKAGVDRKTLRLLLTKHGIRSQD